MSDPTRLSPDLQWPHISNDPGRGYVEHDPIVRLSDGRIERGQHGLMNVRAEIARTAYDAGLLDTPVVKSILDK